LARVPGDKRLVAYYTGAPLEIETLRSHLLENLPDYMVPACSCISMHCR
jgi:arthrofactin-type cyclic lipopeptide synthetase C